jgi:hypothetical protein
MFLLWVTIAVTHMAYSQTMRRADTTNFRRFQHFSGEGQPKNLGRAFRDLSARLIQF